MKSLLSKLFLIVTVCGLFALAGCGVDLQRSPSWLTVTKESSETFSLTATASAEIGVGIEKSLLQGSIWQFVGTVEAGKVFKSVDGAFTIRGANAHEAYLVLRNDVLVGFYLPAEKSWVKLDKPVTLKFKSS